MNAFLVMHPGIHTAIQDLGRPGFMKYGIPASGAADRFSFEIANLLVKNSPSAAVLEITLFRLELRALSNLIISCTGGNLTPTVNGHPLPMWQSFTLKEGDRLAFRLRKEGFRAYLAVHGGFSGPKFLESRSVFTRGLMGKTLQAGGILKTEASNYESFSLKKVPPNMVPTFLPNPLLRVMLGPQDDRFTPQGIATFLSAEYRVSPQSDRMGYRLEGPKIGHLAGWDIISEPISRGGIQVTGDGLPIILLWDAQVSGGYTKIANVISADLDRLAQVMPGEKLRFKAVSLEEAQAAWKEEKARREQIPNILIPVEK